MPEEKQKEACTEKNPDQTQTQAAPPKSSAGQVLFALAVAFIAWVAFVMNHSNSNSSIKQVEFPAPKVISQDELKIHDGEGEQTGIWLAVLGEVFDVTKGKKYYGKGEGYEGFAGRDATKAFVSGDFSEEGLSNDVSEFTAEEMGGVEHWRKFYTDSEVYHKIGVLEGKYYDSQGVPTAALKEAMQKIEEGKRQQEALAEQKKKHPSCNMRWTQNEGGEVWCEDETLFPRKVSEGELGKNQRCACFSSTEISSGSPATTEYPDCHNQHRCKTP